MGSEMCIRDSPCLDRDRPVDLLTRFMAWGMLPCLSVLLAALAPLKDALRTARETGTFSLLPPSTSPGMVLLYVLGPFALALPLALYLLWKCFVRNCVLGRTIFTGNTGTVRYKKIKSLKLTADPNVQEEIGKIEEEAEERRIRRGYRPRQNVQELSSVEVKK